MKLTTIFLLATALQVAAKSTAQTVTYSGKSVALQKVFTAIEHQTSYVVFYDKKDLKGIKSISVNFKETPLHKVLEEILRDQSLEFEIHGNTIVITKKVTLKNEVPEINKGNLPLPITGTVRDSTGAPLRDASIRVKGTQKGTATNAEGVFSIDAKPGDILIISYVGFQTKEITLGSQSNIELRMLSLPSALNEIVVIGYGTQRKATVTGAISSVSSDDLKDQLVIRFDDALKGRAAGVAVSQSSGAPGSSPSIIIRGINSLTNSSPLYVVDGQIWDNGGYETLNPNDIESIQVLKDASAGIYGSRSANGVILVTTKKGKIGAPKITLNSYYGLQTVVKKAKLTNATQYAQLRNQAVTNDAGTAPFADPTQFGVGTNWVDEIFDTAPIMSHNLTVSGGTETSKYFTSLGYFDQKGIVLPDFSDFKRMTFRVNTSFQPKKYIKFGENFNYTYNRNTTFFNTNYWSSGPLNDAINLDPITPAVVTDVNSQPNAATYINQAAYIVRNLAGLPYGISHYVPALLNPLAEAQLADGSYNWAHNIFGNVYLEISPIKGLSFKTEIAAKQAFYGTETFTPLYYLSSSNSNLVQNKQFRSSDQNLTWNWDNTASYTRLIGQHNFTVLLGTTAQQKSGRQAGVTYYGEPISTYQQASFNFNLPTDQRFGYGGDAQPIKNNSFFSRLTYDYDQKYLIQFGFRRDGSSKFGSNNRYANFPSISAGWIASKESWFPQNSFVDYLKIRGSYGILGNEIALSPFQYSPIIGGIGSYVFGSTGNTTLYTGYGPTTLANPDLQWERNKSSNIGFEATMFHNLTVVLDFYKKVSDQLLMQVPLPAYAGVANAPFSNVGGITNKGVELQLGYNRKIKSFDVSLNGNVSYNKNEVTNLNVIPFINTGDWHSANPGNITRIEVGQPINFFYGYKVLGIFQTQAEVDAYTDKSGNKIQPNAKPGDLIFENYSDTDAIGPNDRQYLGNPNPTWTYGYNIAVKYKQFDLSVFGQGVAGNKVFKQYRRLDVTTANYPTEALNAWTPTNTNTDYPRLTDKDPNGNYNVPSSFHLQSGAYMRLKTLLLGYTLPNSFINKLNINRVHLYVSGDNLFTITKYNGNDPEISGGVDQVVYPAAKTFRIGLDVTF